MSGRGTMKNFKAMIAEARPAERSVPVCLRGDLVADHEEAVRELGRAEKDPADSLAGNGASDLAERIQAIEAEMLESSIEFRLRGMSRVKFRAFVVDHPPRRDPATGEILEEDRRSGFNGDTFWNDLLKVSTVEPELDDEDWLNLLGHTDGERDQLEAEGRGAEIVEGRLSQAQWDKLTDAAWIVNGKEVDIPFSLAASRTRRVSEGE